MRLAPIPGSWERAGPFIRHCSRSRISTRISAPSEQGRPFRRNGRLRSPNVLLRRHPGSREHIVVRLRRGFGGGTVIGRLGALALVEIIPNFAPIAPRRGLGIFGGAGFEEI